MGGKIGLKSHRGQGSEFWLELTLLDRPAPGATDRPLSRATEARRVHSTLRSATNENSVRHSATAGARVLVAEDNTTNQKVALRMLEKMGCHADAVSNGREALAMVNRIRYDLILMDVQMPEMDGYVATAEIRRLEKPQGRRVPIIAMTAHAMSGDRDCCLAAGMDDYISKPVAYDHLAGVLERWLAAGASAGQEEANQDASAPSPASQQAFVIDRLREIAAGDRDVERELVQTFVDDIESSLTAIQSALAQGDAVQAARLFHRLAGASGTMGADGLAVLCREAEQGALAGTFSVVTERLAEITRKSGEQRGSLLAHIAR
jgi:CheY-like chemotaxis protein/HPt (histidine-containing phosphotransfer) domain-containing protein